MTILLALTLIQANAYFWSDSLVGKLRQRIERAQSSIDICFMDLDSVVIISALIRAKESSNVRVRVVTDGDNRSTAWYEALRNAGIYVWSDRGNSAIMHNKFAVFDYGDADPANDWAWTGSLNVSVGKFHADNAIEVQDSGLAHAFTQEFEQMWGGSGIQPDSAHSKFHGSKRDVLSRHRFVVGADTFVLNFSPQDHPVSQLTQLVRQAQFEVGFCIFAFTHDSLALRMKERNERGVWVGGVYDRGGANLQGTEFYRLDSWDIPVYRDSFLGPGNDLHEKIMTIDRRIVAAGSVNWSGAGNDDNDENSLIVYSPAIAERYRQEISEQFNRAGGSYAVNDIGVTAIVAPDDTTDTSAVLRPAAEFRNCDVDASTFRAFIQIADSTGALVFSDSLVVGLRRDSSRLSTFAEWPKPHLPGRYTVLCSTCIYQDRDHSNDVLSKQIVLLASPIWSRCADIPGGPRGKGVKGGAGLACARSSDMPDTSYVYALKGNNTREFYRYDPGTDRWETMESIPAAGGSGTNRPVRRGAILASVGGKLYAAKGGNTLEFWRYDPVKLSAGWTQLADVPADGSRLKSGVAAAGALIGDTAFVYLLKGSNTHEFYRYNAVTNGWQRLTDAPAGYSGRSFRSGSALTFDGIGSIYVLKGSTNESFAYSIGADTWTDLEPLPMLGRSGVNRRLGEGAAMVASARRLYVLKGKSSPEFWTYDWVSGQWVQAPDLPSGAGRRPGKGAALVYCPASQELNTKTQRHQEPRTRNQELNTLLAGGVYALKGNNTLEFFRYGPLVYSSPLGVGESDFQVATHSRIAVGKPLLQIAPNPVTSATITYSLPEASGVSLKLYDVTGRLIATLARGDYAAGSYSLSVSKPETRKSKFASGIYLIRLESDGGCATGKLVLR
jgi:hypothetical protein